MAVKPLILLSGWLPDATRSRALSEFPETEVLDARDKALLEQIIPRATVLYGTPPVSVLPRAKSLRWIQLNSAGVAIDLCDALRGADIRVTNLAGLYGPTIAEHALALMLMIARNLHRALRQQHDRLWHRDIRHGLGDLAGKTVAIVGLGNIGQHIARLCQAFGMRVLGSRRTPRTTPCVDRVYGPEKTIEMLAQADFVVVAAPLTRETDGMLGQAEFAAMKRGVFFVNVSRGRITREEVLLEGLRSGHVAGAGLDVFATEPLPADHPLWDMPQVVITPHFCGDTVNLSAQPGELFLRNLRAWLDGKPLGHVVDVGRGY
jgi:phosphoglycerate dehydrogenase-like enzyme